MKKIRLIVGIIIGVVLVAIIALPFVINADQFRPAIQNELSAMLGREMTIGHLLFAAGMSIYVLIAIRYEEHDLISLFGRDYELYRERVGMLTPRFRRRRA